MGILIKLFSKKETPQPVEQSQEPIVSPNIFHTIGICGACKQPIFELDKIRSFNKEKYHLKCFRSNMKLMRKQVGF